MFHQLLAPVANSLFLSFVVGLIPILVVLVLLGVLRRPAWQAALAGLIVGFLIAITVWQMPISLAVSSTLNGFAAVEAVTLTLMFNTTPVAFGALGAPVITLGAVTGLHPATLGAMIGRQLPIFGLILPFYALIFYTGLRSLRTAWPVALVAGLSFALTQFTVSNFINYQLTDVLSALISLLCLIAFVQFWKPANLDQYRVSFHSALPGVQMGGHDERIPRTPIGEEDIPVPAEASEP